MSERQKFRLHCCALDSECRLYAGWCWRVHLNTPWWHLAMALRPKDRFLKSVSLNSDDYTRQWVQVTRV